MKWRIKETSKNGLVYFKVERKDHWLWSWQPSYKTMYSIEEAYRFIEEDKRELKEKEDQLKTDYVKYHEVK